MMSIKRYIRLSAALTALVLCASPLAATEIGIMGASNPDILGTPPTASERLLVLGDAVFQNEEIVSGPDGLGFAMFPDQTTLTIAPNSRLVLDRYVYDPDTGAGEIGVSLVAGAVRFIGGRISKSSDAVIKTPVGTIGIRGGTAIVAAGPDGDTTVTFIAGEYARATSGGDELFISRASGQARLDGSSATYLGVADMATTAALSGRFRTPGDGGAPAARARGSSGGLAEVNSFAAGGVSAATVSTTGLYLDSSESLHDVFDISAVQALDQSIFFSDADNLNLVTEGTDFVDVGGDGLVRGQLVWQDFSDLDLHLILPNGAGEVAFFNREIFFNDGGAVARLDIDNLGGVINAQPDKRIENIVVTGENIPPGRYLFFVDAFSISGPGPTAYTLTVSGDGGASIQRQEGALGPGQDGPPLTVILGRGR
ncbi:MAG: FecR domain-containing protein [Paracoccaceae bacterium]